MSRRSPIDTTVCNGGVKALVSLPGLTENACDEHYCHSVALNSCFTNVNGVSVP